MTREGHARFWERPEVKFLRATRQSLPKCDVRVTSACPPIATEERTFRVGNFGPKIRLSDGMRIERGDTGGQHRNAQCDISTGTVIERRMLCVTPPSTNSRRREWP